MKQKPSVKNLVIISDLHGGCQLGLCPPEGIELDEGGLYKPSELQEKVWSWWEEFWGEWVPSEVKGEPFGVVCNAEAIDGVHHGTVSQITHNLKDQAKIAKKILKPIVELCEGRFYMTRGTEAHSGKSGQQEEQLAEELGATPNKLGQYAQWELWLRLNRGLLNISHHIGVTGSTAYETSAVQKELQEAFTEAGRWNDEIPDVLVRSHRHRYCETRIETYKGIATCCVTPGWQLKTPFMHRIAGARQARPQIGGIIIKCGDQGTYVKPKIWKIERPEVQIL